MHKTVLYSVKIMAVSIMAALCLNSPAFAKKHKKDHQTDNQQSSKLAKTDSDKNERLKKLLEQKKELQRVADGWKAKADEALQELEVFKASHNRFDETKNSRNNRAFI